MRPSGTEPKLKAYLEVTEPVAPGGLAEARRRAGSRMTPLRAAVAGPAGPRPVVSQSGHEAGDELRGTATPS